MLLVPVFCHGAALFESPERAVPLIELFTSEGCNSCPPADAWLSSLASADGLWSEFVPVAFHVTYWDSLGWSDRFAQKAFDSLQATTAASAGTEVYTPGVFVGGEEWRSWRNAPHRYNELPERRVGVLKVAVDASTADVTFDSAQHLQEPTVVLAWLLSGQSTQVRHGENAGKTLHHEFVVHRLDSTKMRVVDGTWRASLPVASTHPENREGVAVWVVDADRVVQATGGWLSSEPPRTALTR